MLTMTRYLATVLFAATLLITSAGFASAQDHFAKIDTLLKQYSDYGLFQGSVLVSDHGKVYEKGFGLASRTGADLDVPGAEQDDRLENAGEEDEENNEYSLDDQENESELDQ